MQSMLIEMCEAAVLPNVVLKSPAMELPRLVIPILGVMATEESP